MRPFGEAKSISGHQTLQLRKRPYGVKGSMYVVTLPALQRCLENGPEFDVVPQGLDVLFSFVLFGDFRSPSLSIFLERFRGLSLWDLVGDVCMNPSWFFSL
jgi:hypothetical protein